jgi:hypothetical protein
MPGAEPGGESERTSNEIVTDLLSIVADLTSHTGGAYTYLDGTPFDPDDTAGYPGEGCVGRQGSSINVNLLGPPAADIEAVQQKVIDTYKAQGWDIILREESDVPEGKVLDVSFAEPTGKQFGFGLGPKATTILLQSECSTHPSLDEPST